MTRRTPRPTPPHHTRGGVPVGGLALLVVLVIVLVMLTMNFTGGKSYVENVAETRRQGQRLDVTINTASLVQLITTYQVQNDRYPTSYEDLEAAPLKDPWGGNLTFTIDQSTQPGTLVVTSAGPDGEVGTEDDIVKRERLAM